MGTYPRLLRLGDKSLHVVFRFQSASECPKTGKSPVYVHKETKGEINTTERKENVNPVFNVCVLLQSDYRGNICYFCHDSTNEQSTPFGQREHHFFLPSLCLSLYQGARVT